MVEQTRCALKQVYRCNPSHDLDMIFPVFEILTSVIRPIPILLKVINTITLTQPHTEPMSKYGEWIRAL